MNKYAKSLLGLAAAGWLGGCATAVPPLASSEPVEAFIQHEQGRVLLEIRADALYPVTVVEYELLESMPPQVAVADIASDQTHAVAVTRLMLPGRTSPNKYQVQTRIEGVWTVQPNFSWHGDSLLIKSAATGEWVEAQLDETRLRAVPGANQ